MFPLLMKIIVVHKTISLNIQCQNIENVIKLIHLLGKSMSGNLQECLAKNTVERKGVQMVSDIQHKQM